MIVNHEFEPFYDENSEILILGSIPSPKSREQGFYYAHPQNRFWKVLAKVFNENEPLMLDNKKDLLSKHHIALWDVIASCEINEASDSSIRNPIVNDLDIVLKNSNIKKIYTTGQKAHQLYYKYCYPKIKREAVLLPSTSPANCRLSLDFLVKEYSNITK